MVAAPHSKGCKTCIRRKVKCGEERPGCHRCSKAKLVCEGYVRDLRWIDTTSAPGPERGLRRAKTQAVVLTRRPKSPVSIGSVLLPGQHEDTYIAFFKHRFLSDGAELTHFSRKQWLDYSTNRPNGSASYLAVHALATLFFARMHGNSTSVLHLANLYYGKALRSLQESIQLSLTGEDGNLTPAALSLTYFEIVAYHSEGGWLHHAGGIGRLMEARGPKYFQEYPQHGYFLLARPLVLMTAMVLRTPTFLDTAEWKTIPWAKHAETKSPSQHLFDMWANGPSMASEALALAATMPLMEAIRIVHGKMSVAVHTMSAWRWKWESDNPHSVVEIPVDPTTSLSVDGAGQPLFDSVLMYKSFQQATEIMYYNVVLITLTYYGACLKQPQLVDFIVNNLPGAKDKKPTNPLGFPRAGEPQTYGSSEICRSLEYALGQCHGSLAAMTLLVPLRLCVLTLALQHGDGRFRTWLATMCDRVASQSGLSLFSRLKYLPKLNSARNLEDERERDKHNVSHTTLPITRLASDVDPSLGTWKPRSGGHFTPAVRHVKIDDMIT